MSREIGQFDISDRQLLANPHAKASEWTEIGEATITYTIFGDARVSIVRKNDKMRRKLSLMILIGILVVAACLGWVAFQQNLLERNNSTPSPNAAALSAITFSQPEILISAIGQKSEAQQATSLKNADAIAAKPQMPPSANYNEYSNPTAKPAPVHISPKLSMSTSVVSPRVTQAATSTPAGARLNKEDSDLKPAEDSSQADIFSTKQ